MAVVVEIEALHQVEAQERLDGLVEVVVSCCGARVVTDKACSGRVAAALASGHSCAEF